MIRAKVKLGKVVKSYKAALCIVVFSKHDLPHSSFLNKFFDDIY